MMKNEF